MESAELEGRVAIVTGASQGIGRETALLLGKAGAMVVAGYRSRPEGIRPITDSLGKDRVLPFHLDVTAPADVDRLVQAAVERFGAIDILVNTASYGSKAGWKTAIGDIPFAEWQRVIDVDLTGTFLCCQRAAPHLAKRSRGSIINFSSSASLLGDPDTLLYNAAKAGVAGLTRSLARSLAPAVRVNAIAPGSIRTGWVDSWGLSAAEVEELAQEVPLKRIGGADEVAHAVLFLAGDRSRHITGQTLCIDGGMSY